MLSVVILGGVQALDQDDLGSLLVCETSGKLLLLSEPEFLMCKTDS